MTVHTNTPTSELPALFAELREAAKTMDIIPATADQAAAKAEAEIQVVVNIIDLAEIFMANQINIASQLGRIADRLKDMDRE